MKILGSVFVVFLRWEGGRERERELREGESEESERVVGVYLGLG